VLGCTIAIRKQQIHMVRACTIGKTFYETAIFFDNVANFSFHRWIAASQTGEDIRMSETTDEANEFPGKEHPSHKTFTIPEEASDICTSVSKNTRQIL
jgi:hypothetical protein